jgi:hypothetical protein
VSYPKLLVIACNCKRRFLQIVVATAIAVVVEAVVASQDIYDENYGYIFCKFFSLKTFDNKHMLFNSELHFSINVNRLSTPLTKTDC